MSDSDSRVKAGLVLAMLLLAAAWPGAAAAGDATKPLRVCLVSGSLEYQSNESLEAFQKWLEGHYNVVCSRAFIVGQDEEHLPGLENLDTCDVMLLFTRRLKLSGEQLEKIKAYCLAGKPIVGVRTASHAIQTWLDLDKLVLGGNYHGHYGAGPDTEIAIVESAKDHPVLAGVRPYRSAGSLYKNEGLAGDDVILLTGAIPGHNEPIAWTRTYKGAADLLHFARPPARLHRRQFSPPAGQRPVLDRRANPASQVTNRPGIVGPRQSACHWPCPCESSPKRPKHWRSQWHASSIKILLNAKYHGVATMIRFKFQVAGWLSIPMALAAVATLFIPGALPVAAEEPVAETTLLSDVKVDAPKVDVELFKDIVYGSGGGEKLKLDLASPKGLTSAAPAIVWIHGGGWQFGSKNEFQSLIRQSALAGYVAVSVDYRLAPKHMFPAQIEDCKCAVRWLRAHAEKLHVDPERIGAVGSSAGAHLVMLLGTTGPDDGLEGTGGWADSSSSVRAVVSFAGPTDLRTEFPPASRKLVEAFLGGTPSDKAEVARAASPITYVSSGDAPMLLFHGTNDPLVPYPQAYQMAEALTGAKVSGRVELMLGEGHGWPKEHARVIEATYEFLARQLKP